MSRCGLATVVTVACVAALAHGQDVQEQAADLPDVVVTDRSGRPAHEIPANVSVFNAAQLRDGNYVNVVNALRDLAGVHVRSVTGNPAASEISLRGFGENSHGRVLVLLDGRRLNRPDLATINWFQIPVSRIARVEVIRGSATALYGDNALGGVINIITKEGTEEPAGHVGIDIGSFDTRVVSGSLSGTEGGLSYSANAEWLDTDGYRDRSGVNSLGGGISLSGKLSEQIETTAGLSWQSVDYELPGFLSKEQMDADPEQSLNPNDSADNEYVNTDLGMTYNLGDTSRLELNLAYGRKEIDSDIESWFIFSDVSIDTVAVAPRFVADVELAGHANALLLGADYHLDALELDRYAGAARASKSGDAEVSKSTFGGYIRDTFAITESLLASATFRAETAEIDADVTTAGATTVDDNVTHDQTAFELSLLKFFKNRSKLFVRGGTTYRYPFVDEQASFYGFGETIYEGVDPEEGWTLEAGGVAMLSPSLSLGLTLFALEMEDEIAYNPVTAANENLDETSRSGAEVQLGYCTEPFTLTANYSYTDAEFDDGPNDGADVPLVPVHRASAVADIYLPLDLALQAVLTYTGESYIGGDTANDGPKLDDYTVVDLTLRYRPSDMEGLQVYAGVENVFDETYASLAYRGFMEDGYYPSPGIAYRAGVSCTF